MILKSKLGIGLLLVSLSFFGVYTLNPDGPNRILINLLAFAGIYAISAMGLNVHFGWTGLINFGHAAFMGVGAYTTILLIPHAAGREGSLNESGLPLLLAIIIGLIASAIFGLVIGLPAIRLRGDYLAIVTIASSEIFRLIVRDQEEFTGGVYGVISFSNNFQNKRPKFVENLALSLDVSVGQLWVTISSWVLVVILFFILKRLQHSPWGRTLKAVREDEDAVRALGKNAVWIKLQSFMLGASIAGLSGILLAFNYGTLQVEMFVPLLTFYIWAIMILGGVGSLSGPVFGSILFWSFISETDQLASLIFENADGQQIAGVRFMLVGILIIILMVFRPSGIMGKKEELLLDVK